jgi:nucleotide-binding universal stress UspA family protein
MRILLAVDGSAPADRAAALIASMPWHDGGRLRIVSVAPARADVFGATWGAPLPPDPEAVDSAVVAIHRDAIERAVGEIRAARCDLAIESILLRGRAASVIVDQARQLDADLVVVGHRGLGAWRSRLLGSVSAEVVDHAPCPVLVVRDDQLGPVVLADDGSTDARAAADLIAGWPLFRGLGVTVIGVVEDGFPYSAAVAPLLYEETMARYSDAIEAERRTRTAGCENVAAELRAAGVDAVAEIRHGDPAHEIVAAAEAARAGLVVVGTRGLTGLRRLILGSVGRNVLLSAPCSVLVVRDGPSVRRRLGGRGREPREVVSAFG